MGNSDACVYSSPCGISFEPGDYITPVRGSQLAHDRPRHPLAVHQHLSQTLSHPEVLPIDNASPYPTPARKNCKHVKRKTKDHSQCHMNGSDLAFTANTNKPNHFASVGRYLPANGTTEDTDDTIREKTAGSSSAVFVSVDSDMMLERLSYIQGFGGIASLASVQV